MAEHDGLRHGEGPRHPQPARRGRLHCKPPLPDNKSKSPTPPSFHAHGEFLIGDMGGKLTQPAGGATPSGRQGHLFPAPDAPADIQGLAAPAEESAFATVALQRAQYNHSARRGRDVIPAVASPGGLTPSGLPRHDDLSQVLLHAAPWAPGMSGAASASQRGQRAEASSGMVHQGRLQHDENMGVRLRLSTPEDILDRQQIASRTRRTLLPPA